MKIEANTENSITSPTCGALESTRPMKRETLMLLLL